jgi:uncharacterized protein YqjF (DUF2071 family)
VLEPIISAAGRVLPSQGQASVLQQVGHRPWPLPEQAWFMAQTWENLLFAHWPVPIESLRTVVPDAIPIDRFDGSAWIGVTPFRVRALRLRGTAHIPWVTSFPETNVRTYATLDGRPGIYFLSLDAASRAAVFAARRTYRLPYFHARMSIDREGATIDYRSERVSSDGPAAALRLRYRATGAPELPSSGSLAHFLTERYCLYTLGERGEIHRADIHHAPWSLQPAEAEWEHNSMAAGLGLELSDDAARLHFARCQDVLIWRIAQARAA